MMSYEFNTLGDLLSNPKIRPVAQDAIRRRNLKEEELWNMTLSQLKEEHFFSGEISNVSGACMRLRTAGTGIIRCTVRKNATRMKPAGASAWYGSPRPIRRRITGLLCWLCPEADS